MGEALVTAIDDIKTFKYDNSGPNVSSTNAVERVVTISQFQRESNITTITTASAHGFEVGDIVLISDLNASVDGYYNIYTVNTPNTSTFQIVNPGNTIGLSSAGSPSASATVSPAATYTTWGEYTENGDIGVDYSTTLPSQYHRKNQIITRTYSVFRMDSV